MKKSIHQKLNEIREILTQYSSITQDNKCFLSNCQKQAIGSHTISKSRVLKLLERKSSTSKKIVVLHLDDSIEIDYKNLNISTYHKSKRKLYEDGKGNSSVFWGFCNPHDNQIFDELDNQKYLNISKINFLHSLRAYSYYSRKQEIMLSFFKDSLLPNLKELDLAENIKILEKLTQLETIKEEIEKIPEFQIIEYSDVKPLLQQLSSELITQNTIVDKSILEKNMQKNLASFYKGSNYPMSIADFKKSLNTLIQKVINIPIPIDNNSLELLTKILKSNTFHYHTISKKMSAIYNSSKFDELAYKSVGLNGIYLICGSFVFLGSENRLMSLTFFPDEENNKTHFIFSSLEEKKGHDNYLSAINILDPSQLRKFITNLILNQGTNIYLSLNYWEKLNSKTQKILVSRKRSEGDIDNSINLFSLELMEA